ncbi:MetQ/NlpA family ABC transporter substrate-binding protein [Acinetobacter chinensis]|jgi:D-methionine transport system substrate-binding protein|uniref:MetQ/NlpA family ABC transporter substrate-binding protein n=1 Tax=Acinetobacter chinensis TaxID=2004650 RepID=A0ABU3WFC9_9GAMM|nr:MULTISPECIES: MetQ/NlpA family ABC transporter substrate-binding protein [Acinetobacter]AXY60470.1 NLPA lipoprotein [Acinetobacter sp. WCHAc010052]MDV2468758.1 MetQ/NlpA family ABC transporter substrate-binding protein [Acinetobacter chinensis]WOE40388.1 MetQ/NlpA family ABC transporter substrate-binding protein [Acinetobacter chinensis]
MKKLFSVLLSASVLTLSACGKQEAPKTEQAAAPAGELTTVTLASSGSDTDIWNYIATLPETKQAGIELKVKNFTDYVSMNTAVANKEIDANAFQSYAYMVAYNDNNKDKVAPIATTYLEPMGIYSSKVKKVEDFATGATIAIPNDGANESRALLLLQSAGLVKLKADFDNVKGTPADITENKKNIVIKPIQMATAVRAKDEVDAIVLGNVLAMEGGLNVIRDSIYHEPIDQSTKMNVNIVAVADSRKNDPVLEKLGTLYHTPAVEKYIQEHFDGTKVDVNKPVSYLTESKQ